MEWGYMGGEAGSMGGMGDGTWGGGSMAGKFRIGRVWVGRHGVN